LAAVRHLWEEGGAIIKSPKLATLLPFGAAALVLVLAGCGKREQRQTSHQDGLTQAVAPKAASGLSVQVRHARGRAYLFVEQRPPALEIRLARPDAADRSILLSVAGTYTSPEGRPEGVVAIDGKIIEHQPKPWEGILVVKDGAPTLLRADKPMLEREAVHELIGPHGSLIQGHLLVDGVVQRLKPSPSLRRRAIAIQPDGAFFFAESQVGLPLAEFAADLEALGARRALNLDMGEWSEGFYRDPTTGDVRRIGDDDRKTSRQTNWLVLVERAR
jgi:hypothetical protein